MPFSIFYRTFYTCLLLVFLQAICFSQLKVAEVFSSNMVLQRDKPVTIWGKAWAGKEITVSFAGQRQVAITDNDGKWRVQLQPLSLSAVPAEMQISSDSIIRLQNILVGDVWLCTGQSNMEYPMDRASKRYALPGKGTDKAKEELDKPGKPDGIRYIYVERTLNKYPLLPAKGWINGNDTTLRFVSAIGYFFAKEIYEATNVPIGIISSSWGGTRVEQWTPPAAYASSGIFKQMMTSDTFKIDGMKPGQVYNGMIEPLVPFAIKGVLWYQGESNCMIEDQDTYVEKMRVFEESWRNLFNGQQLPFYTVQVSPYLYSGRKDPKPHSVELLPRFWEAQTKTTQLPQTYMVVTTDLMDNLKDIHPSYKWTVGRRLALQVLHNEYDKKELVCNSPQFKSMKRKGNKLVVSFTNTGSGFQSSDGKELTWFSVAGDNKNFVPANATIAGNKLIVEAEGVRKPKFIRFAWHETAMPNLINKEGLPCISFRTDNF